MNIWEFSTFSDHIRALTENFYIKFAVFSIEIHEYLGVFNIFRPYQGTKRELLRKIRWYNESLISAKSEGSCAHRMIGEVA